MTKNLKEIISYRTKKNQLIALIREVCNTLAGTNIDGFSCNDYALDQATTWSHDFDRAFTCFYDLKEQAHEYNKSKAATGTPEYDDKSNENRIA